MAGSDVEMSLNCHLPSSSELEAQRKADANYVKQAAGALNRMPPDVRPLQLADLLERLLFWTLKEEPRQGDATAGDDHDAVGAKVSATVRLCFSASDPA